MVEHLGTLMKSNLDFTSQVYIIIFEQFFVMTIFCHIVSTFKFFGEFFDSFIQLDSLICIVSSDVNFS